MWVPGHIFENLPAEEHRVEGVHVQDPEEGVKPPVCALSTRL